jgi:hypothetical protein
LGSAKAARPSRRCRRHRGGAPERSGVNPSLSARQRARRDENSFGEPEGRTDKAAGLGPSGPERSAVNPSLSARQRARRDENSFGEPVGRTGKADRHWAVRPGSRADYDDPPYPPPRGLCFADRMKHRDYPKPLFRQVRRTERVREPRSAYPSSRRAIG